MNELQKELDKVYNLLNMVAVSGDGVDAMAAARAGLRKAFQMAAGETGEDAVGEVHSAPER